MASTGSLGRLVRGALCSGVLERSSIWSQSSVHSKTLTDQVTPMASTGSVERLVRGASCSGIAGQSSIWNQSSVSKIPNDQGPPASLSSLVPPVSLSATDPRTNLNGIRLLSPLSHPLWSSSSLVFPVSLSVHRTNLGGTRLLSSLSDPLRSALPLVSSVSPSAPRTNLVGTRLLSSLSDPFWSALPLVSSVSPSAPRTNLGETRLLSSLSDPTRSTDPLVSSISLSDPRMNLGDAPARKLGYSRQMVETAYNTMKEGLLALATKKLVFIDPLQVPPDSANGSDVILVILNWCPTKLAQSNGHMLTKGSARTMRTSKEEPEITSLMWHFVWQAIGCDKDTWFDQIGQTNARIISMDKSKKKWEDYFEDSDAAAKIIATYYETIFPYFRHIFIFSKDGCNLLKKHIRADVFKEHLPVDNRAPHPENFLNLTYRNGNILKLAKEFDKTCTLARIALDDEGEATCTLAQDTVNMPPEESTWLEKVQALALEIGRETNSKAHADVKENGDNADPESIEIVAKMSAGAKKGGKKGGETKSKAFADVKENGDNADPKHKDMVERIIAGGKKGGETNSKAFADVKENGDNADPKNIKIVAKIYAGAEKRRRKSIAELERLGARRVSTSLTQSCKNPDCPMHGVKSPITHETPDGQLLMKECRATVGRSDSGKIKQCWLTNTLDDTTSEARTISERTFKRKTSLHARDTSDEKHDRLYDLVKCHFHRHEPHHGASSGHVLGDERRHNK